MTGATELWGKVGLREAIARPITGGYLRLLAVFLLYGASVHVGNILGWSDRLWMDTPLLWRVMDILLLLFDVVVAVGLWLKKPWAAIAFPLGLLMLQFVPYTVWRSQFVQTPADAEVLNGLMGTEAIAIVLLMLLVGLKR